MDLYGQNIMDHMKNPHHAGILPSPTTAYKEVNPYCGDEIEVFLEIQNDTVKDVSFQGQGCAISQAAISILTDELIGMSTKEILVWGEEQVQEMLGMQLTQRRKKCALLGLLATQNAILTKENKTLKTWRDFFID